MCIIQDYERTIGLQDDADHAVDRSHATNLYDMGVVCSVYGFYLALQFLFPRWDKLSENLDCKNLGWDLWMPAIVHGRGTTATDIIPELVVHTIYFRDFVPGIEVVRLGVRFGNSSETYSS